MKFFTTSGPVNPADHYYVPNRLNEKELHLLIEQKKYFILHAPRQTGKTTEILDFVKKINTEGKYVALYINVEPAQAVRSNYVEGNLSILREIRQALIQTFPENKELSEYADKIGNISFITASSIKDFLTYLAQNLQKPLVLFIDEIDSLVGDTLISVLRQLRAGYTNRPQSFPLSVCLIGVRDVRDYRIWSDERHDIVLGGSAFNIKSKSLRLGNFSKNDVRMLYLQHTQETKQKFTDDAIEYAFEQTQGQPWLVNALAYEACFEMVTDRNQPITKDVIEQAKVTLIKRQDTHIDVLIDRLREPRVRRIIDFIIQGEDSLPLDVSEDDLKYARDLGLVSMSALKIANPIYQEIIPRSLTSVKQETIMQQMVWYQNPDGSINMHKLLEAFTQFYRENADIWLKDFDYKESGPHLLMMAFLQRVINGGGKLHREYALGRGRVDLLIEWQNQRIVVELKLNRGSKYIAEGLVQTADYMDKCKATEGHLVVFDRSSNLPWEDRVFHKTEKIKDRVIDVWGM